MANTVFQILSAFFARYGYWVVFFGVLAENIGFPFPGETVLLFAGFLAAQGKMHIVPAILTAIAGATGGASLGYLAGGYGGSPVVNRFLVRFPRLRRRYDDAQKRLVKHGPWALLGARFLAGLRVFAGVLAGALRMPFSTFLLYSFTGAICWALVIGYVGFLFGDNWDRLIHFVGRTDRIMLAIVAALAMALLVVHVARRRKRRAAS